MCPGGWVEVNGRPVPSFYSCRCSDAGKHAVTVGPTRLYESHATHRPVGAKSAECTEWLLCFFTRKKVIPRSSWSTSLNASTSGSWSARAIQLRPPLLTPSIHSESWLTTSSPSPRSALRRIEEHDEKNYCGGQRQKKVQGARNSAVFLQENVISLSPTEGSTVGSRKEGSGTGGW